MRIANILDIVDRHADEILAANEVSHQENLAKSRDRRRDYMQSYYSEHKDVLKEKGRKWECDLREVSNGLSSVHGEWSDREDLELMADDGRTVFQKAVGLGRAYDDCRARRKALRRKP